MRKKDAHVLSFILALVIVFTSFTSYISATSNNNNNQENNSPLINYSSPPALSTDISMLMDADSGQILFENNMSQSIYPASTTKILTSILALEKFGNDLTQEITIPRSVVNNVTEEASIIALVTDEVISIENLLYATLVYSACDAASALAFAVSGDEWETAFPELMNEKAKELGAKNSNFLNAHGLHNDNHYTTAYDMAMITKYAMQNETFMKIVGTTTYTIPATNKKKARNYISTTNKLLKKNDSNYYAEAIGIKTGTTAESGFSLVSAAEKDGIKLIAVVMNTTKETERFSDAKKLLEYGFSSFTKITLTPDKLPKNTVNIIEEDKVIGHATANMKEDISFLLHNSFKEEDLIITCDMPESYSSMTDCTATLKISVADNKYMYINMPDLPMTVDVEDLSSLPPEDNNNKGDDAKLLDKGKILQIILFAVIVLVIGGLGILIATYVHSNMMRRNNARERRLERLKTRSVNPKDDIHVEELTLPPVEEGAIDMHTDEFFDQYESLQKKVKRLEYSEKKKNNKEFIEEDDIELPEKEETNFKQKTKKDIRREAELEEELRKDEEKIKQLIMFREEQRRKEKIRKEQELNQKKMSSLEKELSPNENKKPSVIQQRENTLKDYTQRNISDLQKNKDQPEKQKGKRFRDENIEDE